MSWERSGFGGEVRTDGLRTGDLVIYSSSSPWMDGLLTILIVDIREDEKICYTRWMNGGSGELIEHFCAPTFIEAGALIIRREP